MTAKPPAANDWEARFRIWKENNKRETIQLPVEKIVKEVEADQILEVVKEKINTLNEPLTVKVLKIIIIFIPLFILGYVFYANVIASQDFQYFYDIGAGKENSLSPISRITPSINSTPNYRNLTNGLVYFTVPIPRGSDTVSVQVRFKDNFPQRSQFKLGAKDKEEWHYIWRTMHTSIGRTNDTWIIGGQNFSIQNDSLVVKDGKLSIILSSPHFSNTNLTNFTIPVDWINITVHKNGVFE